MASIIYIGMDVQSNSYSLCCYSIESNECFVARTKVESDYKRILQYLKQVGTQLGGNSKFICGYEAGCLGYTLYNELGMLFWPQINRTWLPR